MPNSVKRAVTGLVVLALCYSLLGFLIVPGAVQRIANQQLARHALVPARLERVEFNPLTLELTLHGLHLGATNDPQLAFRRLYGNLQIDSLWRRMLHLRGAELDGLQTQILFAADGTLNLAQLFRTPEAGHPSRDEPSGEPFPLQLERLHITDGRLRFQDLRTSEPVELSYEGLDFSLHNLTTVALGEANMTLVANAPDGGRIDWKGTLSLNPIRSSGSLLVTRAQMRPWWPYVRDAVPLVLTEGALDLSSDYRLDLADSTELTLSNARIELSPFAIQTLAGKPLVALKRLKVSEASLDLAAQQVTLGAVRGETLDARVSREADGRLNWQKLFNDPAADRTQPGTTVAPSPSPAEALPAADAQDNAPAQTDQAGQTATRPAPGPWQVLVGDVQLSDYRVHLRDEVPAEPVELLVGPFTLSLQDFDSLGASPFQLALDSGIGKQGRLTVAGSVLLDPVSAQLKVSSQDLDLRLAQAYLAPFVRIELRSGLLASDLAVNLQSVEPLAFSIDGKAAIRQLHTLDTLKGRDFVKWPLLELNGIAYRHEQSLSIDTVSLQQPYARFLINEDRSTNISELIIEQPASDAAPAPASSAEQGRPLAIRIGAVEITNGSGHFADFSLTPAFSTALQQLNGKIGTMDNRKQQAARVDIRGNVDRYAPVTIVGSLNPFDPLARLDIATRFQRVELTTLTPYSGKFAGYRIHKGRLDLDLHYRIVDGRLDAENKVVVEQLQLGERVDSPDAVDLPIRLAVALLKDSKGRISIELPVKGDLNDPQFSVMPIVWQTLRNLIVRAAAAPFKFIAGIGGAGDEQMGQVPFAAGSAELGDEARGRLDRLASALKERPALRLEIEGGSSPASDGPTFAAQRLEREYRSSYYKILQRRGDRVPASASQLEVPEDEKALLLEGIYRSRLARQPPEQWQELDRDERSALMRQAVIEHWSSSESLARRLGQQRAAAIKRYLVEHSGLSDERVYLLDVTLDAATAHGQVISPLHLGAE